MLDEASEVKDDRRFRYVYTYNKDKERSTVFIYLSEKIDGKWRDEVLYDIGTYSYDYDSQGRVKAKTVTYGKSGEARFTSYRVLVDYGQGITTYTKYEDSGSEYSLAESWGYHDNGRLASHTVYDYYNGHIVSETRFYPDGGYASIQNRDTKRTYEGEVNDSTITYYDGQWNDGGYDFTALYSQHYKYDSATGRMLEYMLYPRGGDSYMYYDVEKYEYVYDHMGRISAIRKYNDGNDDDCDVDVVVPNGAKVVDSEQSINWTLDYEETYTYFNNDVYALGNSWYDLFGMEGPVVSMHIKTDGYVGKIDFVRDASGKLTDVIHNEDSPDEEYASKYTFSVDANGHITGYVREEGRKVNGDFESHDKSDFNYTWKDGKIVKYTSEGTSDDEVSYYKYGDDCLTITTTESSYGQYITYYEKKNGRYLVKKSDYQGEDWGSFTISEIQKEDVAFVRPNVMKDMEGFSVDSTIVVSVAGRVVNVGKDRFAMDDAFREGTDGKYYFFNIGPDDYYSVSHAGDKTICRDIEDRPVFILQHGRLVREYVYFEEYSNVGSDSPGEARQNYADGIADVTPPEGQSYDVITWKYTPEGLPVVCSIVSVDADGTRSEEIIIEYKYDTSTGIASAVAEGSAGITLNGRTLGLGSGQLFSVYDMSGRAVVVNVQSYTFASPGMYIVRAASGSVKINVK